MRQGVLISTTEHLLSALIGMGVDNVIVELDNLELPILDGSALPYVKRFSRRASGRRDGGARRFACCGLWSPRGKQVYWRVSGEGYRIQYAIDFPAPIGQQTAFVDLAAETYGNRNCGGAHLWLQGRREAAADMD